MTNTNTELVWKGRMIVTQDGHVDLPPDRQGLEGPTDAPARMHFIDQLNDVMPQAILFKLIRTKLQRREINTRKAADIVLLDATHEGERWLITGNTNASAGYFYVTARCMGPAAAPQPRKCFYIPTDAFVEGKGFVPSLVTEGEPGHSPLVGNGDFAEPWYWGDTYEKAQAIAAAENAKLGLTPDDVLTIILGSMGAGSQNNRETHMKVYSVTWTIDSIDADSPEHAAKICREMLLDPANTASIFIVTDQSGEEVEIDTLANDPQAIV